MARRSWLLSLAIFLGLVGCDHATKWAAETHLRGRQPVDVVPGAVDLRYAENPGIAFSAERLLPAPVRTPLIAGAAVIALAAIAYAWRRRGRELSMYTVGYALVAAGAVGNVADRVVRGHVVDFIHVRHWPIFNVADVCLAVGIGVLLLAHTRPRPRPVATG